MTLVPLYLELGCNVVTGRSHVYHLSTETGPAIALSWIPQRTMIQWFDDDHEVRDGSRLASTWRWRTPTGREALLHSMCAAITPTTSVF